MSYHLHIARTGLRPASALSGPSVDKKAVACPFAYRD